MSLGGGSTCAPEPPSWILLGVTDKFKCWAEFTAESVCSWTVTCWEVLGHRFRFLTGTADPSRTRTVQVHTWVDFSRTQMGAPPRASMCCRIAVSGILERRELCALLSSVLYLGLQHLPVLVSVCGGSGSWSQPPARASMDPHRSHPRCSRLHCVFSVQFGARTCEGGLTLHVDCEHSGQSAPLTPAAYRGQLAIFI